MTVNGILNIYKEAGMTSHDVVFKLRKIFQTKKIGHGGTLDPDVTGVLPIAVGKATRVIEYMTEAGKIYEGQVTLGFSTETEDASGTVVASTPVVNVPTTTEIDAAMADFVGKITQIPPMYSAVKVNGRKLYEYARAGETIERPQRQVTISEQMVLLTLTSVLFVARVPMSEHWLLIWGLNLAMPVICLTCSGRHQLA